MPAAVADFLISLTEHKLLWSVSVIVAMAVTAAVLYTFWDMVGRAITLVTRTLSRGRAGDRR